MMTASEDTTMKYWNLEDVDWESESVATLKSSNTVPAHEREINGITIAPNDKLAATSSQDKTAKVFIV